MNTPPDVVAELVADVVDGIANAWHVPGGVVVVTDREGIVAEHAFGLADREAVTPASSGHLFEIGSISKIFTAAVALQLVAEGSLRLDQSIGSVLPWLPPALLDENLTIERLLQHTAGLVGSVDAVPDETAQLRSYSSALSTASPGSFFHYSNVGFILVGRAAAAVTGCELPALVRDRVLRPLGMRNSIASVTADDSARLAVGYQPRRDDRPWIPGDPLDRAPQLEVAGADGSIATTAADLARFARMLLSRGAIAPADRFDGTGGSRILDDRSFDAMITRLAPDGEDVLSVRGLPSTRSSRYGLGINVEERDGQVVLTHGGGMVGYASFLFADQGSDRAIVVLTNANGDSPVAEAIARTIAVRLTTDAAGSPDPLDPMLWRPAHGSVSRAADRTPDAAALPPIALNAMLGRFEATTTTGEVDELVVALNEAGVPSSSVRLTATHRGHSAALTWDLRGRILSPLAGLRRFPLEFDGTDWISGDTVYAARPKPTAGSAETELLGFCGRYRSYTPWFPTFRIVLRGGSLVLLAPGGVEAPGEPMELVGIGASTFRIGSDPRLAETLTFGPIIDGVAAWADRDGCRYSRSFVD